MIVKVFGWIPRSQIHVAEIVSKLGKGFDLEVSDVQYDSAVNFTVKEFKGYKNLAFRLDNSGLYSLSVKVPEENIERAVNDFYEKAKEFILEKIIKYFHKVTYVQIIDGILPLNYFTVAMTVREHPVKGYDISRFSSLRVYSKKSDVYSSNAFVYVSGHLTPQVEKIADLLAFTAIASHFLFDMMNKMESYHNGTKEVIRLLEHEPNSELINNAYLNLDLVKKDAAESWAKVEQAIDCISRKRALFEDFGSSELIKGFGVDDNFMKLDADKSYIFSLWTLLINHLEYVDTAVEARVNFKSMLNDKASQWLGFINTGFLIAALVTGLLFFGSGVNSSFTITGVLASWFVAYMAVNFIITRKNS